MKKIFYFLILVLFTGCNNLSNTPTKKVEEFFSKYQTLDNEVISELNKSINDDITLTDSGKKKYIEIMKDHYQNLKYEIKNEVIDGDTALVTVMITVKDYSKIIYGDDLDNNDIKKINDDRLSKMKNTKDVVNYTLEISLILVDKEWRVNNLSNNDYLKIHGLYGY